MGLGVTHEGRISCLMVGVPKLKEIFNCLSRVAITASRKFTAQGSWIHLKMDIPEWGAWQASPGLQSRQSLGLLEKQPSIFRSRARSRFFHREEKSPRSESPFSGLPGTQRMDLKIQNTKKLLKQDRSAMISWQDRAAGATRERVPPASPGYPSPAEEAAGSCTGDR